MDGLLAQRRVLIAGGSAGIGLVVARQAQRNGAEVIVASRRAPDRLAALGDDELSRIKAYAVDVTSQNDLKHMFDAVGQIDRVVVLPNNLVRLQEGGVGRTKTEKKGGKASSRLVSATGDARLPGIAYFVTDLHAVPYLANSALGAGYLCIGIGKKLALMPASRRGSKC